MDEAVRHEKVKDCAQLLAFADESQKATVKGTVAVTQFDVMR